MDKHSERRSPCDESMDSSRSESYATAGRSSVYSSIPPYSDEEAYALAIRLDNDETFKEAVKILIAWLESGECNERNSLHFHFLIQLCWNRVEKLQAEEKEYQEEIKRLKKSVSSRSSCIQRELVEIEEIFSIIEKQNLLIYFTQNQVDNLHNMKTNFFELKYSVGSDFQKVSDVENNDDEQAESNVSKMQAKLDSLTCELNTVHQETEKMQSKCKEYEDESLEQWVESIRKKLQKEKEDTEKKAPTLFGVPSNQEQREVLIFTLSAIFLFNRSGGASVDEIYAYLKHHVPINNAKDVEYVLRKYPKHFRELKPNFPLRQKDGLL